MKNKARVDIIFLSGILCCLLILWIITMVLTVKDIQSDWQKIKYIQEVMRFRPVFVITYMNATLLTIVVCWLFYKLSIFFEKKHQVLIYAGLLFTGVYGLLNVFAYFSQITALPFFIRKLFEENISVEGIDKVYNWIQMAPYTMVSTINASAYAILGIPSIIYGVFLLKTNKPGKLSGWFLIANAIACFIGIIGWIYKIPFLEMGIVLGGILFTVSIGFMFLAFRQLKE